MSDEQPLRQELNRLAALLYEQGGSVRPRWEQLGEDTQNVWRGYVLDGQRPVEVEVEQTNL